MLDVDDAASDSILDALKQVAREVPAAISSDGVVDKAALFAAMMSDAAVRSRVEACLRPHVVNEAMEAAQLPESEKMRRADVVMCTDGPIEEMAHHLEAALKDLGFDSGSQVVRSRA